ncbi:MAG: TetR/AcrR family transcriptional regulator C-terminal domain-containing protein [Chloroflexota bacterium]
MRREPLTRERVIDAAIELADRDGLGAVTMRRLGQHLGVEAMSLYKHVPDKDAVLAGIADKVAAEFTLPAPGVHWRTAIRDSSIAAHAVLLRHPWAGPLLESSLDPGPARLAYLDAVVGVLRDAGFPMIDVAHAFAALDSHLYGFTMQVVSWPFDVDDYVEVAAAMAAGLDPDRHPNLAAIASAVAASEHGVPLDFTFGLDLLLDGLERRLDAPGRPSPPGLHRH